MPRQQLRQPTPGRRPDSTSDSGCCRTGAKRDSSTTYPIGQLRSAITTNALAESCPSPDSQQLRPRLLPNGPRWSHLIRGSPERFFPGLPRCVLKERHHRVTNSQAADANRCVFVLPRSARNRIASYKTHRTRAALHRARLPIPPHPRGRTSSPKPNPADPLTLSGLQAAKRSQSPPAADPRPNG